VAHPEQRLEPALAHGRAHFGIRAYESVGGFALARQQRKGRFRLEVA
jgi:hypothetical protein